MSRETFYHSVRTALRAVPEPEVELVGTSLNRNRMRQQLCHNDLWLSTGAVEGFDPQDFEGVEPSLRRELEQAVRDFRSIAANVPKKGPATEEQRDRAMPLFEKVVSLVGPLVREEWIAAVGQLMNDAQSWCRELHWEFKVDSKQITERLLGTYQVPTLLFHTGRAQLMLDPIARFVPRAVGVVDLYVMPSLDSATVLLMLTPQPYGWRLHVQGPAGPEVRTWGKDGFAQTVERLIQLA